MKLDLNDEQLRTVVGGAILSALSEEKRNEIMQAALAEVLGPATDRYGNPDPKQPSRLQEAFTRAAGLTAQNVAKEMLEQSEYKEKLRTVMAAVFDSVFEANYDVITAKLADTMSTAMLEGFSRKEY